MCIYVWHLTNRAYCFRRLSIPSWVVCRTDVVVTYKH